MQGSDVARPPLILFGDDDMLAGYGRFVNDNVRTAHLKCSRCKTRVHLIRIETDEEGCEVRSFSCRHCADVSVVRFNRNDQAAEGSLSDVSAC